MTAFTITYEVTAERLNHREFRLVSVAKDHRDPYKRYESPHFSIDGIGIHNLVVRSEPKGENAAEVTIKGDGPYGLGIEIANKLKPLVESHSGLFAKRSTRKGEKGYSRKIASVEVMHISEGAF